MNTPLPPVAIINHLLAQDAAARSLLATQSGKIAQLDLPPFSLRLRVTEDGWVEAAPTEMPAQVTVALRPADVPLVLANRERAMSFVTLAGDADFANLIGQLSRQLRWEAEADLAPWVGDIAANRLAEGARQLVRSAQQTQQSFAENVAEYLTEENPILLKPQAVRDMNVELQRLRDDVERLMKRCEKLESRRT